MRSSSTTINAVLADTLSLAFAPDDLDCTLSDSCLSPKGCTSTCQSTTHHLASQCTSCHTCRTRHDSTKLHLLPRPFLLTHADVCAAVNIFRAQLMALPPTSSVAALPKSVVNGLIQPTLGHAPIPCMPKAFCVFYCREVGLRFHPTRGAMSMGKSKGGAAPDSTCEEEEHVLKDMAHLIKEFHDPSRCDHTTPDSPRTNGV